MKLLQYSTKHNILVSWNVIAPSGLRVEITLSQFNWWSIQYRTFSPHLEFNLMQKGENCENTENKMEATFSYFTLLGTILLTKLLLLGFFNFLKDSHLNVCLQVARMAFYLQAEPHDHELHVVRAMPLCIFCVSKGNVVVMLWPPPLPTKFFIDSQLKINVLLTTTLFEAQVAHQTEVLYSSRSQWCEGTGGGWPVISHVFKFWDVISASSW